jgi:hypothetical protein
VLASQSASAATGSDPGLEYLEGVRAYLGRAASASGGFVDDNLQIAGIRLRLSFAGSAMRDALLPPFEHLAIESVEKPELRIAVFDSTSSGVEPPRLPWPSPSREPGTHPLLRFQSKRVCLLASPTTGALTVVDLDEGEAVFFLPDASRVPPNERAAPLRQALHLLMASRQRWMIHAGAVGQEGCGALLVGRGGSGKSTLALSCALAGMEFVADDYLLLEMGPAVAHAMQSTAKLTEDSARRLALCPEAIDPAGFEPMVEGRSKAIVDVRTLCPDRMRPRLSISAIVAPEIVGAQAPELEPVSPARALRALAPSTLMQSGSRDALVLAALAELVREVPSYSLRLSPNSAANAAAVATLVNSLA